MSGELVLVTGGTGYIANYCIKELLERGYRVRTTVRDLASPKCEVIKNGCQVPGQEGKIEIVEANLNSDAGWNEAADGCAYVLHTASPVGDIVKAKSKKQKDALVKVAEQGTLRALRGAAASGVCKRVVLTASAASIMVLEEFVKAIGTDYRFTEDSHADKFKPPADGYSLSKIKAERAGWKFAKANNLEMATIHPTYVVGPSMSKINRSAASEICADNYFLMPKKGKKQPPVFPISMWYVDVRDVAKMHVEMMIRPEAGGRRYIAHNRTINLTSAVEKMSGQVGPGVSTKSPPCVMCCLNCCLNCCLCCSSDKNVIKASLKFMTMTWKSPDDKVEIFDNTRSKKELGISYTDIDQTFKDHAKSWQDNGMKLGPWMQQGQGSKVAPTSDKIGR